MKPQKGCGCFRYCHLSWDDVDRLVKRYEESIVDCACHRLVGVLADGEELPGHVCRIALEDSCRLWAAETVGATVAGDEPIHIPLGNGRMAGPLTTERVPWPIPMDGSQCVVGALRQWVEEKPGDAEAGQKLARILESLPEWPECIRTLEEQLEGDLRELDVPGGQELLAANVLGRQGLPTTPGTVRFALSKIGRSDSDCLPTKGLLVESLLLIPMGNCGGHGGSHYRILGSDAWETDALRRRAGQVAAIHSRWWSKTALPEDLRFPTDRRKFNCRAGDEELREDIAGLLIGDVTRTEVLRRAEVRSERQKRGPLKPMERRREQKRIEEAIRREGLRQRPS